MATITASIAPLFLLACPISMGLMMFFMGKGMMGGKKEEPDTSTVEELKADHERLSAEVERLEREKADSGELVERR
jgi:hypothetical protein